MKFISAVIVCLCIVNQVSAAAGGTSVTCSSKKNSTEVEIDLTSKKAWIKTQKSKAAERLEIEDPIFSGDFFPAHPEGDVMGELQIKKQPVVVMMNLSNSQEDKPQLEVKIAEKARIESETTQTLENCTVK